MIVSRTALACILTLYDIMVHYNADKKAAAQTPPPRCPKCGSHRTELIGTSQDQKITHLRCAACGVRSEVPSREAVAV
jgi:transcription elongation factor Elf1